MRWHRDAFDLVPQRRSPSKAGSRCRTDRPETRSTNIAHENPRGACAVDSGNQRSGERYEPTGHCSLDV